MLNFRFPEHAPHFRAIQAELGGITQLPVTMTRSGNPAKRSCIVKVSGRKGHWTVQCSERTVKVWTPWEDHALLASLMARLGGSRVSPSEIAQHAPDCFQYATLISHEEDGFLLFCKDARLPPRFYMDFSIVLNGSFGAILGLLPVDEDEPGPVEVDATKLEAEATRFNVRSTSGDPFMEEELHCCARDLAAWSRRRVANQEPVYVQYTENGDGMVPMAEHWPP